MFYKTSFFKLVRMIKLMSFSISLLIYGGCATLSEDQCLRSNWYEIGFDDGRNGKASSIVDGHAKACSKYNVVVNEQVYADGRTHGLRTYCTYENGVHVGRRGDYYNSVCADDAAQNFLMGYSPNYRHHRIEGKISSITSNISSLQKKLDEEVDKKEESKVRDGLHDLHDEKQGKARKLIWLKHSVILM